jgi:ankyrin repeat protein
VRKEAKQRLKSLREHFPDSRLYQAQLDIARSYGFPSWRALHEAVLAAIAQHHADSLADRFLHEVGRGTLRSAKAFLAQHPGVINQTGAHPFWGGRPQALHVAIEREKTTLFKMLLAAGADPSGDNAAYDGWSPLMLAAHWQRGAMITALLDAGARIALPEALMLGRDDRVAEILSQDPEGAFDTMPNQGTPLHFCTTGQAVSMLLAHGVNPHQTDQYGKTALDAAVGSKVPKPEVVIALQTHLGTAQTNAGHLAAMGDSAGLASWLAFHPDGLNNLFAVQWHPQPLLHIAAERSQDAVVRWLLDHSVVVDQEDQEGLTALHAAAWNGHLSTVQILVAAGADIHHRDKRYNNTAHTYVKNNWDSVARPGCDAVTAWLESRMG